MHDYGLVYSGIEVATAGGFAPSTITVVLLAAALLVGWPYLRFLHASTNDAYVNGSTATVTSRVTGTGGGRRRRGDLAKPAWSAALPAPRTLLVGEKTLALRAVAVSSGPGADSFCAAHRDDRRLHWLVALEDNPRERVTVNLFTCISLPIPRP